MTPKAPGALCSECPSRNKAFVPPERHPRVRLAVVGEAPGANEIAERRPFVGSSGRMLNRGFSLQGIKRNEVHWTNAVLCPTARNDLDAARKCCAPRLKKELEELQPEVIVAAGAHGLSSVLGADKPIIKWRGSVVTRDMVPSAPPGYLMPILHPAFVMRAPGWELVFDRDLARVGRVVRNGWKPPEAAGPAHIYTPAEDHSGIWVDPYGLCGLVEKLGPEVAVDVETVGTGAFDTDLVCIGLSDGDLTIVIPYSEDRAGQREWWGGKGWRDVSHFLSLALKSRTTITHNGPAFDHVVMKRYGIEVGRWEDTMHAYHALEGHLPKRLSHVVTQFLDVGPWKELEDRTADLPRLWQYNARDCLYTRLSWERLKEVM